MEPGTTINAAVYSETLRNLRKEIQNKKQGMFTKGVMLLHDNAQPHVHTPTKTSAVEFYWDTFDHPLYSPDSEK